MNMGIFPAQDPTTEAAANGGSNTRLLSICIHGVRFSITGLEQEYSNIGGLIEVGSWLATGLAQDVWVENTVTAGSWNRADPGAGRHNLGTARIWQIERASAGTHTVTSSFKFYDAASGGNLLQTTASAVYSAEFSL